MLVSTPTTYCQCFFQIKGKGGCDEINRQKVNGLDLWKCKENPN